MTIAAELTIQSTINNDWNHWTQPEHIPNWNYASEEWSCPSATNDLRPGREFIWRMEAEVKDASIGTRRRYDSSV